jgi:type IV pilus assembly protein PilA
LDGRIDNFCRDLTQIVELQSEHLSRFPRGTSHFGLAWLLLEVLLQAIAAEPIHYWERSMLKSLQKGFTLIELMIVVAIIGILAAIAIPAYQDYLVRSQVSEGLTMAAAAKAGVSEYYANRGEFPESNSEAGMGDSGTIQGKYVLSVGVGTSGAISVIYGNEANASKLIPGSADLVALVPGASENGDVIWQCGRAPTPAGWTGGVTPATEASAITTVPGKFLPSSCR